MEFGAGDGWHLSNIRMFMEDGWDGTQWDTEMWTTAENVNHLFTHLQVPETVDLVSIDLDGNDYWIWRALAWRPSVMVIEFNAWFEHGTSVALEYDPGYVWNQSYGYSASLDAMCGLAERKGYFLAAEVASANLIFVREEFSGLVPGLDRESVPLGWSYWVDHGQPCTKTFVEVTPPT